MGELTFENDFMKPFCEIRVWGRGCAVHEDGGLVFQAHRLLYHSTLGLRVIEKRREGVG